MSADPRAIIYYGVRIKEEDMESMPDQADEHDANDDWKEANAPKDPGGPNDQDYKGPAWDAWRAAMEAYKASFANVEIDWSGCAEERSYYVHCPCLEKWVEWDDQIDLGRSPMLGSHPEADEAIRRFCAMFSLPYQRPSWHLAALYF